MAKGKGKNLLTDMAVRHAQPREKMWKLDDGDGLRLHIEPSGKKRWVFRYWLAGHESSLSFGSWPETKLSEARRARDEARGVIAENRDPAMERKAARKAAVAAKQAAKQAKAEEWMTFEVCSREWFSKEYKLVVSEEVWADTLYRMERDLFPLLGAIPMKDVDQSSVRKALELVRDRGAVEQARRHLQVVARVFRYARACGYVRHDPCSDLRGFIPPVKGKGFAAVTDPRELAPMLRAMDEYSGAHFVRMALRFLPLVFLRPGELRKLEWSFYDEHARELRVPGSLMKIKDDDWHIVPLSNQALAILAAMWPFSGSGRYIFPGRDSSRPQSENTLRQAIRSLGSLATPHGFRKTASTILNESGKWHRDAIERQLAHMERDAVRATYNYAEHLPERREMMQWWADYLDALKGKDKVVNFPVAGGER